MKDRKFFHYFLATAFMLAFANFEVLAQASDKPTLLQPSRVWNFSATLRGSGITPTPANYSVSVAEETKIGEEMCTKVTMKYHDKELDEFWHLIGNECTLQEKDGLLSVVSWEEDLDATIQYPLLDFNLKEDEEVIFRSVYGELLETCFILKVDTILVKGRIYKRQTIGDADNRIYSYWVEGIGSSTLNFQTFWYSAMCSVWLAEQKLESVYQDGELIFEHADFATTNVVPDEKTLNDVQNHLQQTSHSNLPSTIFDLQGRRMQAVPERGVFIKDGKVMVK